METGFYWTRFIRDNIEGLEIVWVENNKVWLHGIEKPLCKDYFSYFYGPIESPEI